MTRINLLPPEERSRAAREQGLLLAIVGLVALVVALGAVYFLSVKQVSAKQTQVDQVSAQVDAANVQLAALKPYAALQVQRQAMTLTAQQVLNARITMSNIFEEIGLLIPDGMSLKQLTITVPPYMVAGANDMPGTGTTSTTTGDIAMYGDSTGATLYEAQNQVATLMTQLGMMPQLMNISLVSSVKPQGAVSAEPDVGFQITASLRPFATTPPLAPAAPAITMGGGQ